MGDTDDMIAAAQATSDAAKADGPYGVHALDDVAGIGADLAAESLAANIATAKEVVKAGHVPASAVAKWLHAQVPGAFADEAAALAAIQG